ncbi:hypothetical protein EBB07_28410 [Paenibacillaceae bacterium]|nr:hypothetical protein EBB07_28410 [Paenibacillaceae bacterium]
MKDKVKGLVVGLSIGLMFSGAVALAADYRTTIQPMFKELNFYFNGDLKVIDEAIAHNGTTYVPVRTIAKAVGTTVKPDFDRQSIYLGKEPKNKGLTLEQAMSKVWNKYKNELPPSYKYMMLDSLTETGEYRIKIYAVVIDDYKTGLSHTTTYNFYDVNKHTGKITPEFD